MRTDFTPDGTGSARAYRLNDLGVVIDNDAGPSYYSAFRSETLTVRADFPGSPPQQFLRLEVQSAQP